MMEGQYNCIASEEEALLDALESMSKWLGVLDLTQR